MTDVDCMKPEQVGELLKCSARTVIRLAVAKKLPSFRVGKLWRFRSPDVLAFVNRQAEASGGRP